MNSVIGITIALLLPLLCAVTGEQIPAIVYISEQKAVNAGKSVELMCSTQFVKDHSVLWTKSDGGRSVTLSSGDKLETKDERFSVRNLGSSNTYTLRIKNVSETDAGVYQCQISHLHTISADVELLVIMPPTKEYNTTVEVNEGESVELTCQASGFYQKSWKRQNNAFLPTGGKVFSGRTLRINNAQKEHRGMYYCVSDDYVVRQNVTLFVKFAPVVSVPYSRLEPMLDSNLELECQMEAYPIATIFWLEDGHVLIRDGRENYKITKQESKDKTTVSMTLKIKGIKEEQYRKYTCQAANKLAVNRDSVELIASPAITKVPLQQAVNVGKLAKLKCKVQFAGDHPVIWMKMNAGRPETLSNGSKVITQDKRFSVHKADANTYTLRIKNLKEEDAGMYQCQILMTDRNRITKDTELLVVVNDDEETLVVPEGQSVRLDCVGSDFSPSWKRQNNELLPTGERTQSGSTLRIDSAKKEDRGMYYCVSNNYVVRRELTVFVEFAPIVSIPQSRLEQALGYNMEIECNVEGYPPPTIHWNQDGEVVIKDSFDFKVTTDTSEDETSTTTKLTLETIESNQYRTYVCRAANKLGTTTDTVVLVETDEPDLRYPPSAAQSLASCFISVAAAYWIATLFVY